MQLFSGKVEHQKIYEEINSYVLWSIPFKKELDHLATASIKINHYPAKTIVKIIRNKVQKENVDTANETWYDWRKPTQTCMERQF